MANLVWIFHFLGWLWSECGNWCCSLLTCKLLQVSSSPPPSLFLHLLPNLLYQQPVLVSVHHLQRQRRINLTILRWYLVQLLLLIDCRIRQLRVFSFLPYLARLGLGSAYQRERESQWLPTHISCYLPSSWPFLSSPWWVYSQLWPFLDFQSFCRRSLQRYGPCDTTP